MEQDNLRARWNTRAETKRRIIAALKQGTDLRTLELSVEPNDSLAEEITDRSSGLVDLRGIAFEDVDLAGANLEGLDLSFATFFKVSLKTAVLSSPERESKFEGAKFIHCDLRESVMYGADFSRAHFGHCNLSISNLSWSKLDSAIFRSSNLFGSNLTGTSLRNAEFAHSDIRGIKVSEDTAIGVMKDGSFAQRIRLEDDARSLAYDRFQFATSAEAFRSAAEIYECLAEASDKSGMSDAAHLWRRRHDECLQLAGQSTHTL